MPLSPPTKFENVIKNLRWERNVNFKIDWERVRYFITVLSLSLILITK
jgi:hypothetical protein